MSLLMSPALRAPPLLRCDTHPNPAAWRCWLSFQESHHRIGTRRVGCFAQWGQGGDWKPGGFWSGDTNGVEYLTRLVLMQEQEA